MRARARLFKLTRAVAGRGPTWLAGLHSAWWLRLLAPGDIDDITMDSYSDAAGSGFESAQHNLGGLLPWEEEAFAQALAPATRVLVAGAGGGREMIALARTGHRVSGFDASRDLVEACRRHLDQAGVTGEMHWAAPGRVPPQLGRHGALVLGRGFYHHLPGRARRIAFLAECRQLLAPGAPVLVGDFLYADEARRPDRRAGKAEAGDFLGSAFFHRFARGEIEREFAEAGFVLGDVRPRLSSGREGIAHAIGVAR